MSSAPYGVRLLVGVAATAVEETRKLPQTILMYPMTVVSQLAHLVMKMQQDVADLVIKGDATLENLFPPKDEQPEWATFDEDDAKTPAAPRATSADARAGPKAGSRCTRCPTRRTLTANGSRPAAGADTPASAPMSAIAGEIDYDGADPGPAAGPPAVAVGRRSREPAGLRGGHQGPGPVPDPAGQQDHPRVRQVTRRRRPAGSVRGEPVPGARRRDPGGRLDRQAGHGLGRGSDHPDEHAARTRRRCSWCCATPPPTCRCPSPVHATWC